MRGAAAEFRRLLGTDVSHFESVADDAGVGIAALQHPDTEALAHR
jgi:hypothetical protein